MYPVTTYIHTNYNNQSLIIVYPPPSRTTRTDPVSEDPSVNTTHSLWVFFVSNSILALSLFFLMFFFLLFFMFNLPCHIFCLVWYLFPPSPPPPRSTEYVPTSSPSRCGDVTVDVYDMNQPSLPTPFYSVLVSISVFMALSTVFHFVNCPYNSLCFLTLFYRSCLCLLRPFSYVSLNESLLQLWYNPKWLTGLKTPINQLTNQSLNTFFTCSSAIHCPFFSQDQPLTFNLLFYHLTS